MRDLKNKKFKNFGSLWLIITVWTLRLTSTSSEVILITWNTQVIQLLEILNQHHQELEPQFIHRVPQVLPGMWTSLKSSDKSLDLLARALKKFLKISIQTTMDISHK